MTLRRPQILTVVVFVIATFVSFAPHLAVLAYQAAGATPPAGLLLFCPLHHALGETPHAAPAPFALHARPLVHPPAS
jgi:hypothetical protein